MNRRDWFALPKQFLLFDGFAFAKWVRVSNRVTWCEYLASGRGALAYIDQLGFFMVLVGLRLVTHRTIRLIVTIGSAEPSYHETHCEHQKLYPQISICNAIPYPGSRIPLLTCRFCLDLLKSIYRICRISSPHRNSDSPKKAFFQKDEYMKRWWVLVLERIWKYSDPGPLIRQIQ